MEVEVRSVTTVNKGRKRRSSTSSTSLSPPSAKENLEFKPKRKRTKSESRQQLTFWGWSPKQAKFKPKIMNEQGLLKDHPNPEALSIKSKWQPIVSDFYFVAPSKVCFDFDSPRFDENFLKFVFVYKNFDSPRFDEFIYSILYCFLRCLA